jgi:hypothetical protein
MGSSAEGHSLAWPEGRAVSFHLNPHVWMCPGNWPDRRQTAELLGTQSGSPQCVFLLPPIPTDWSVGESVMKSSGAVKEPLTPAFLLPGWPAPLAVTPHRLSPRPPGGVQILRRPVADTLPAVGSVLVPPRHSSTEAHAIWKRRFDPDRRRCRHHAPRIGRAQRLLRRHAVPYRVADLPDDASDPNAHAHTGPRRHPALPVRTDWTPGPSGTGALPHTAVRDERIDRRPGEAYRNARPTSRLGTDPESGQRVVGL